MRIHTCLSTVVGMILLLAAGSAVGGETVKITGLHLCCGGCVSAVEEALKPVTGLSDVEVDQELRTATFSADDDKAIQDAGTALLEAGFFGEVNRGGKTSPLAIPENAQIATGTKADRAVFDNVHLCCKNCSRGVTKSLAKIREVVAVDCDTKAHTVTLTGKDMDLSAVAEALHAGGFHGTFRRESAENTARAGGAKAGKSR
jgi:copper chaperone CopZ